MKKRFLPFFLASLLLIMAFTGCSTQKAAAAGSSGNQDQTSYNGNPSGTDSEKSDDSDVPIVYMTADISPAGMMAVYEALGWKPTGKAAVKLS